MRRGTTPTHKFVLPFDAEIISTLRIIYAQGQSKIIKNTEDVSVADNEVSTTLTQQETLSLDSTQPVEIQLRVLTKGGEALASDVIRVHVSRLLEDEVLT